MKFPAHLPRAVLKFNALLFEQLPRDCFVAVEVTERFRMPERKRQWPASIIEADKAKRAGEIVRQSKQRECVGRRAKAHVPDHEFAGVCLHPLADFQLPEVKRLGFRRRAEAGVHLFVIRGRVNRMSAIAELDEFVLGGGHGRMLSHGDGKAKRGGAEGWLAMLRRMATSRDGRWDFGSPDELPRDTAVGRLPGGNSVVCAQTHSCRRGKPI